MAAETVKNRSRTPKRYLGEENDDDYFNMVEPARRESKLKRKNKPKKEVAQFSVALDESGSPSASVSRKERLARRSLEEIQFQQELEKVLQISAQETGLSSSGDRTTTGTGGAPVIPEDVTSFCEVDDKEAALPQANNRTGIRISEEDEDSGSIETAACEFTTQTSVTTSQNSAASACKKRKLTSESWIVNKREEVEEKEIKAKKVTGVKKEREEKEEENEELVPMMKRKRRAAVMLDTDSEDETEQDIEPINRPQKSGAEVSLSQASTLSPPGSPQHRTTAKSLTSPGKENQASDYSDNETESEEEFVPKQSKAKKAPKAKTCIKNVEKVSKNTTAKSLKPLSACNKDTVVPAVLAVSANPAGVEGTGMSSPLLARPLIGRLNAAPSPAAVTQVKIPAWTPPGRVKGDLSRPAGSSPTLLSPAIGLRVGLSRNMKVAKPLHSSVKNVS